MQLTLSETDIDKLAERIIQRLDNNNFTLMLPNDYPVSYAIIKQEILNLTTCLPPSSES